MFARAARAGTRPGTFRAPPTWRSPSTDARAEYARLSAAGVRFVSPPNEITAGVNAGGFACYFLDPDEITLEFVQPPPR
ncbi:VOC family protein [Streptosporangium vulgare]|uniref:VOC family protein n=1 Tax=Streptosporangium vulgare TaxID=46190 RepID=UPI0031E33DFF